MDPNVDDPRPHYVRLADELRASVLRGEYQVGAKLPTVRQLSEDYGVADQTVRSALRELQNAGVVSIHQGRGTFVRSADAAKTTSDAVQEQVGELRVALEALTKRVEAIEADRPE